jgi:hypothetical protein
MDLQATWFFIVQSKFGNVSVQDNDTLYSATGYSATIVVIIVAIINHLLVICIIGCKQIIPRKTSVGWLLMV